ncbi:hypothetical protein SE17_25290, partial [Kouleothrix aurantiaca]
MKICSRYSRKEGQSVVIFALVIVVLIGVAGLGMDGANAFNQRRNVANAADAASIAGTKELIAQRKNGTNSNTSVCQAVSDYISNHKLTQGVSVSWTASYVNSSATATQQFCDSTASPVASGSFPSSSNGRGVMVSINYTFGTMFMSLFGRSTLPATGTATALYGPLSQYTGGDVVPFTVSQNVVGQIVGHSNVEISITKLGAGNFGGVNFNPNSPNNSTANDCNSSTYKDSQSYYWCNGSPKYPVYIGEDLPGNPGMVSNSLSSEIGTRVGDVVLMPVFSGNAGTGANATFSIVGFLAVRITSYTLTGNQDDRGFRVDYVSY